MVGGIPVTGFWLVSRPIKSFVETRYPVPGPLCPIAMLITAVRIRVSRWVPMAMGFVLISAAPGKEKDVFTEIQKIKEVVELHPLFGE